MKAEADDRVRQLREEVERKERQVSLLLEESIAEAPTREARLREEVRVSVSVNGSLLLRNRSLLTPQEDLNAGNVRPGCKEEVKAEMERIVKR